MSRPKTPRYFEGYQLADRLYPDAKGRHGYWRRLLPDGTSKTFRVDAEDLKNSPGGVEFANLVVSKLNSGEVSALPKPKRIPKNTELDFHIENYISYIEECFPNKSARVSWKNRKGQLRGLGNEFIGTRLVDLTISEMQTWFLTLSYDQQKQRKSEFRDLFNWLMGQNRCPQLKYNPFTKETNFPHIRTPEKPDKKRARLFYDDYKKIYDTATDMRWFQIAMEISLYTTLRLSDIASLRFDKNVTEDGFYVITQKSANQRGLASASRLRWEFAKHPILRKLVFEAKQLSISNNNCPYIISRKPDLRRSNCTKSHRYQILPDYITKTFTAVRKTTLGLRTIEDWQTPPTFHEIRSLSSALLRKATKDNSKVSLLMGHTDEQTTLDYQHGHEDLPYEDVDIKIKRPTLDAESATPMP
jgi:integrase